MASFPIGSHVFIAATFLILIGASTVRGNTNRTFSQNICQEVDCGRGRCETDDSYPFYKCDCNDGWKHTRLDDDNDDHLEFLPCVIPECRVNYSCMPAPSPIPPFPSIPPQNTSFFDPCRWNYCGDGTCTRNNTYGHTCQCNSGSSNLLNVPAYPCYRDCAIKSDSCGRLGIKVGNSTAGSTTSPGGGSTTSPSGNRGISISDLGSLKLTGLAILLALIFWK